MLVSERGIAAHCATTRAPAVVADRSPILIARADLSCTPPAGHTLCEIGAMRPHGAADGEGRMTQSWRPDDWADDNDAWRGELHRDPDDRWRGLEHIADWPEAQAGPEYWMYKRAAEDS